MYVHTHSDTYETDTQALSPPCQHSLDRYNNVLLKMLTGVCRDWGQRDNQHSLVQELGYHRRAQSLHALSPLILELIYDRKHDLRQRYFFPLAVCLVLCGSGSPISTRWQHLNSVWYHCCIYLVPSRIHFFYTTETFINRRRILAFISLSILVFTWLMGILEQCLISQFKKGKECILIKWVTF